MGAYWQVVLLEHLALVSDNENGRVLGLVLGLDDDLVLVVGILVGTLLAEGHAALHIVETYSTCGLDDGDGVVRIPFADEVSLLDGLAILLVDDRAIRNIIVRECDACVLIHNLELGHTADNDFLSETVDSLPFESPELLILEFSVVLGLDGGISGRAGSGTSHVECTEGKLGTRLTDGLGCDDSDNLALLDHAAGGKVTSVALCADSLAGLAGKHGTDLDLLDRQ